jgi:membrane fusion protein (multidrug efflux system)
MHDVAKPVNQKQITRFFRRPMFLAIGGLAALLLLLVLIKAMQIGKMMSSKPPMPVETVTSAQVKEEDWAPIFSSVGSISPVQGAIVSTELAGVVGEIKFENGGTAKKGDVLVRLDASAEEGQLHSSEADLDLARADLERTRDLAKRKVVSKAELDASESKFKQKQGNVDQMRSMITKKEVRAPFDGQLGIRQVNVGQMINPGQQVVPLQALDSVYVDFALPQQFLAKLSPGLEVRVRTDAVPGREFVGKLTAINPNVDMVNRNVQLQATLENQDHALRPGVFAKIDVVLPEKSKTLVVPGTAVSYAPYGDSVFVIEKKKDPKSGKESETIRQQFVRVGEARGDFVSITNGLKAGETVVGTGVFKLRNGMAVTINNDLAPKPQVNPTPADS